MSELLELSSRYIDEGVFDGPSAVNRVNMALTEVADDTAMIEAFSHVVVINTGEGPVLFDVSLAPFGPAMVEALRTWTSDPVHSVVYTHGHVDHVGGMRAFLAEAEERGRPKPDVIGHANVPVRFDRYDLTNGYNTAINQRQFGGTGLGVEQDGEVRWPRDWVKPTTTYDDRLDLTIGDERIELHHDRGETDDHTWAWLPGRRAVCTGDFLCWVFPNAGNPQKVQRYPGEWAAALRSMAALEPELLLPAHGLPIAGRERIATVLDDVATALETIVAQTLELMNDGRPLDEVIHAVEVPADLLDKPYLRPTYDEPEFIVRNVWRLYGGWYDGNPSRLKPPSDDAVAVETARLVGGVTVLARRAQEVAAEGDLRLACHLVELAGRAAPDDPEVHGIRAEIYRDRRYAESSLMAKGVFGDASRQSSAIADPDRPE